MNGVRDTRRFRRLATGAVMIAIAPIVLAGVALKPADDGDAKEVLATVAAHASAWEASLLISILAIALLIPATLGLMRVAQQGSAILALIGGSLSLLGWVAFMGVQAGAAVTLAMAVSTADRAGMSALYDQLGNSTALNVIQMAFVIGHVAGIAVLGIALARSRMVPTWIGIVLVISGPLHFAAHAIGIRQVDLAAFTLLVLGYAATGVVVLRMADERWDGVPSPARTVVAAVPAT